jgi:hypothetical protein
MDGQAVARNQLQQYGLCFSTRRRVSFSVRLVDHIPPLARGSLRAGQGAQLLSHLRKMVTWVSPDWTKIGFTWWLSRPQKKKARANPGLFGDSLAPQL